MTVTCPSCNASLTIPDDRLPKGRVVTAACPRCKGPIAIDTTAGAPSPPAPAPGAPPSAAPVSSAAPAQAEQPEQSAIERRQPQALVCVPAGPERNQVLASLKELGFAPQTMEGAEQALEGLRFTPFALAVVRDGFGGDANPVAVHVAEMGMAKRRTMLTVLISPGAKSHDPASAYSRSVDLLLQPEDLPHLAQDLRQALTEKEQTYRVYMDILQQMGKV
jgi:hypothetical protein